MRLASYNVENLFMRPRAMNGATLAEGRQALADHAALNRILAKDRYEPRDRRRILELLVRLELAQRDDGGRFAVLRQNRGDLVKRRSDGTVEVVARGRGDWIGWAELKVEEVSELATLNTARVIRDLAADVLAVVEVESRPALCRFSANVLPAVGGGAFEHSMVIDGNDDRGIDVGVMTKGSVEIEVMRSHVDDADEVGRIFSRDCAEYQLRTSGGTRLLLLVNHLKSKGYGVQRENDAVRKRQAERIRQVYDARVSEGQTLIAVVGDFNDTPDSKALAPLLWRTELKDVATHPAFVSDGRAGTYANGSASAKIDYLLLSPALFGRVRGAGYLRTGVWGGVHGTLFPHLPEVVSAKDAASDHAAVWADLDLP